MPFAAFMETTLPTGELFALEEITITGSKALTVHKCKRPRGRPRGPRGLFFVVPGFGAHAALDCAVELHGLARRNATSALIARRSRGERDAFGGLEAVRGRSTLHFAFACVLAASVRLRGGVL